jgi:hypothetical protein
MASSPEARQSTIRCGHIGKAIFRLVVRIAAVLAGLAVSRSIVEPLGGRLWATANCGHGTTFYFTLSNEVAEGA